MGCERCQLLSCCSGLRLLRCRVSEKILSISLLSSLVLNSLLTSPHKPIWQQSSCGTGDIPAGIRGAPGTPCSLGLTGLRLYQLECSLGWSLHPSRDSCPKICRGNGSAACHCHVQDANLLQGSEFDQGTLLCTRPCKQPHLFCASGSWSQRNQCKMWSLCNAFQS